MKKIKKKNKQKKITNQFLILRYITVTLISGFFVAVLLRYVISSVINASYFHIISISSNLEDSNLDFEKLARLKGKNIFKVNLKEIHRDFLRIYPDAGRVRVLRKLPNQIFIEVTPRIPFARFSWSGQSGIIDRDGYVISRNPRDIEKLPLVTGFSSTDVNLRSGNVSGSKVFNLAVDVIETFRSIDSLNSYHLQKVDVSSPSRINIFLNQDLHVIIDKEHILQKLNLLEIILSKSQIDQNQIYYIDLRFREPVVRVR